MAITSISFREEERLNPGNAFPSMNTAMDWPPKSLFTTLAGLVVQIQYNRRQGKKKKFAPDPANCFAGMLIINNL